MANLEHEPASSLEDTSPRPAVKEPAITLEDTNPRQPVVTEFERPAERSGCGNTLLIGTVLIAFACLFVTAIGLAGLAGWRDGVTESQSRKAAALVGTLGAQATLASQDCANGRFELCNERCKYVETAQPYYPGMTACMSSAKLALSATPTPGATSTPTIQPTTAAPLTPTLAATSNDLRETLYVQGQTAVRLNNYDETVKWFEPLRGLDPDFHRKEVEDALVVAYQAQGDRYKADGRLSEMVVVIQKALKIRSLADTDWAFTINVAQLYLDGKGYLVAGNYIAAATVFTKLMVMAPTFRDTEALACQSFAKIGDTGLIKKYNCKG
ncbi:MAG: hypothetical protein ABI947_11135 [Chloroflexota bacterium]